MRFVAFTESASYVEITGSSQQSSRASKEALSQRADLVKRIENLVQTEFGSQYRCEVFGSVAVRTDRPESDLDVTVIVRGL